MRSLNELLWSMIYSIDSELEISNGEGIEEAISKFFDNSSDGEIDYMEIFFAYNELLGLYLGTSNKLIKNMKYCDSLAKQEKKYKYFFFRNKEALFEIEKNYHDKIKKYLLWLVDADNKEKDEILQAFRKEVLIEDKIFFFDPELDFSKIQLFGLHHKGVYDLECYPDKSTNKEDYSKTIDQIVEDIIENDKILNIVNENHVLYDRQNIFTAIIENYRSNNYDIALNLVVMQFEGVFEDYFFYAKQEKQVIHRDSLAPKVLRALYNLDWFFLYDMYYPYFAFDFNELRNEIAHKGKRNGEDCFDLKLLTQELIIRCYNLLNLFTSNFNPYENLKYFFDNIHESCQKIDNLYIVIIACQLNDIYKIGEGNNNTILSLLKNYENNRETLEFYKCEYNHGDGVVSRNLYEECELIMDKIKTKNFWDSISKMNINDHIDELEIFSNEFIGYLKAEKCEGYDKCRDLKISLNKFKKSSASESNL